MTDKINHKVNAALESLDGIIPAEPQPFLLTRVNAFLRQRESAPNIWQRAAGYIKRPAVAACSVAVLLALNIFLFSTSNFSIAKESTAKRIATSKYDFAINVAGIYDTENQEP